MCQSDVFDLVTFFTKCCIDKYTMKIRFLISLFIDILIIVLLFTLQISNDPEANCSKYRGILIGFTVFIVILYCISFYLIFKTDKEPCNCIFKLLSRFNIFRGCTIN